MSKLGDNEEKRDFITAAAAASQVTNEMWRKQWARRFVHIENVFCHPELLPADNSSTQKACEEVNKRPDVHYCNKARHEKYGSHMKPKWEVDILQKMRDGKRSYDQRFKYYK